MKPAYRQIRLNQIGTALAGFEKVKRVPRPQRGWLRAIREALGLKLQEVGRAAHVSHQQIVLFENAEAEDRITLASLRRIAVAMNCELVYAIVPKSGTLTQLAERNARVEATKRVLSVEHSMALENQGVGRVKELIDSETRKITKRRRP
jgi:predicted DNA-binding mobile mystery protein A